MTKFAPVDIVSTAEAAGILGVSVVTVNRWVRSGDLTPIHKGAGIRGAHMFHRRDVVKYAEKKAS